MKFIEYIFKSFDNSTDGASGKKLTALAITIAYVYSHRFLDSNNLGVVLGIDASLITALFGINEIGKFKNKAQNENTSRE